MKKTLFLFGIAVLSATSTGAVERVVDTRFIPSPRTAFYLQSNEVKKTIANGRDFRDCDLLPGMVILSDGKLGESDVNFVREIPVGNLKGIRFRTITGSSSLAWATYDANRNVCRLGPDAQVEKNGNVDLQSMPEYEILFRPQEKFFCYCVSKTACGKIWIRYVVKSAGQAEK